MFTRALFAETIDCLSAADAAADAAANAVARMGIVNIVCHSRSHIFAHSRDTHTHTQRHAELPQQ